MWVKSSSFHCCVMSLNVCIVCLVKCFAFCRKNCKLSVESCVKETMNWRHCWRAGVISRNEKEEEEVLFVWMVFLCLNARSLSRTTAVREGMSISEVRGRGNTFQSDDTRITEWSAVFGSSEWSEFRQVYSSFHFIIITSHDQFSWIFIVLETECTITKSNGSQFRQI